MTARPPDLILVMTDQQRHDQVGYAPVPGPRTPNLDALAASGVRFTNAYSASTTCVPARTSLMTGVLDHRAPHVAPLSLEEGSFTVPRALRAAGYQTALVGKMHFHPMRADHGFDHVRLCEHLNAYVEDPRVTGRLDHYHDWLEGRGEPDWRFDDEHAMGEAYALDPRTHPTSWVRDETLAFLEQRDPERPLLLVVSFPHPHPPVNPPEPYASMYDPSGCPIDPDGAARNRYLPQPFQDACAQADHPIRRVDPARLDHHRASLARTWGLVTQIDDAVGAIVGRLDLANALLWFTSDHGDFAGNRGLVRKIPWIPFDDLAKVPCFATGGLVSGGRVEDAPVQSFDVATTFLGAAGVDLGVDPSVFDGIDLGPALADPSVAVDAERLVFSAVSVRWPMVRRGDHKYIRELGWGREVLFDVARDPDEVWNVLSLDVDRAITDELSAAVDRQLNAPLAPLPRFGGPA